LDALAAGIKTKRVNWVLDADFREFFTSIDHRWLERFLEHRIADGRVLRLIQRWLSAGVIEEGSWTACEEGVPQGGVSVAAGGERVPAAATAFNIRRVRTHACPSATFPSGVRAGSALPSTRKSSHAGVRRSRA
jgi:hypothetical protein